MLDRIPRHLLKRAADLPENAHALPALQRALRAKPAPTPRGPENVRESASSACRDTLHVVLPLPPKELHPNARVHWAKKQRLTREARQRACIAAKDAIGNHRVFQGRATWWQRANVKIIFYHPSNRRRDADSALASCKALLDGIADAGVIANDSGFSFLPVQVELDRENPRVEIWIAREA